MSTRDKDRYEVDEQDGLKREIVGAWCAEKHQRLRHYVSITQATRAKYAPSGSSYIDLFCGTGRARIRDTNEVVDGSAVVAGLESIKHTPFQQLHIGDLESDNVSICATRLANAGIGDIQQHHGPALETAHHVVEQINPYGLHLAFLDPYNLDALPFAVLETLGRVKRMDLLMHISEMDLQRNVIGKGETEKLDTFAPGWRDYVDLSQRADIVKQQVLSYWKSLLTRMGYLVSDNIERVKGSKNQPLYWLVLASKHPLADKFWGQVSNVQPQMRLGL